MTQNVKPDETFKAEVLNLAWGGAFICSTDASQAATEGRKAFIREVAPGEIVEAVLNIKHKSYVEGSCLQVLKTSPDRITPECPLFGNCGGCDLQHLNIQAQRQAKLEMLKSTLRMHAGCYPEEEPCLTGDQLPAWRYRNRISLHLSSSGEVGFFKSGSGTVVDMQECLLADSAINSRILELRKISRQIASLIGKVSLDEYQKEVAAVFYLRDTAFPGDNDLKELCALISEIFKFFEISDGRDTLAQSENTLSYPAGHFAQVNDAGNELLVKIILESVSAPNVLDLYAGAGNFSLPLARLGKHVRAVEVDPKLVKWGQELALRENLQGSLRFTQSSCEKYFRNGEAAEAVILDPPRSGAKSILQHLKPETTREIIYVSCNLPALTRDLKTLTQQGYRLRSVKLIDMFPQTHHIETVSLLLPAALS